MIDCVESNNKINENSWNNKDTIQDRLISTGEISQIRDSKGVNSYPDLHQIIKCNKNIDILNNRDDFTQKVYSAARSCFNQGYLSEY